jgi:hypothetical protein
MSDVSTQGFDYPDVTLVLQVLSLYHIWSYFAVLDAFYVLPKTMHLY